MLSHKFLFLQNCYLAIIVLFTPAWFEIFFFSFAKSKTIWSPFENIDQAFIMEKNKLAWNGKRKKPHYVTLNSKNIAKGRRLKNSDFGDNGVGVSKIEWECIFFSRQTKTFYWQMSTIYWLGYFSWVLQLSVEMMECLTLQSLEFQLD